MISFKRLRAIDSRQFEFLNYFRSVSQSLDDLGAIRLGEHQGAIRVVEREIAAWDSREEFVGRADRAQVWFEDEPPAGPIDLRLEPRDGVVEIEHPEFVHHGLTRTLVS